MVVGLLRFGLSLLMIVFVGLLLVNNVAGLIVCISIW